MRNKIIIIILFFINFSIFSDNVLKEKILNKINLKTFYLCDEEDLDSLKKNKIEKLKYLNFNQFFINFNKNNLEISDGALITTIQECLIEGDDNSIILIGNNENEYDSVNKINTFVLVINEIDGFFYNSYNHYIQHLYIIDKKESLKKRLEMSYKKYWIEQLNVGKTKGFKIKGLNLFLNNKEYDFLIYPVIEKKNNIYLRNDNYLGFMVLNSNDYFSFLIKKTNNTFEITNDINYSLVKEGAFLLEE